MNIFSILSIISCITYLYLGFYVLFQDRKKELNKAFFILCMFFSIWAFGYSFVYSAHNKEEVWLWFKISSIGWCFFPAALLEFILSLTKREKFKYKNLINIILFIIGLIFLIKTLTGSMYVKDFSFKGFTWIEIPDANSNWYWAYNIYVIGIIIISFLLCRLWINKSVTKKEKKQVQIIVAFGMIPFTYISFTEIVLPIFVNIKIPDLDSFIIAIWAIGVRYAIVKYNLMKISPVVIAEEILKTMKDFLIVIDLRGNIISVNQVLLNLLNYEEKELVNESYTKIMLLPGIELNKVSGMSSKELIEQYKKGYLINYETYFLTRNGSEIPISLNCSILIDKKCLKNDISSDCENFKKEKVHCGNIKGFVIMARDIREKKEFIENLQISYQQLGERTAAFEKAKNELEERKKVILTILENTNKANKKLEELNKTLVENKNLLSTEKNKIESVLNNISDGIIVTDMDNKLLFINSIAQKIINIFKKEIVLNEQIYFKTGNFNIGDLLNKAKKSDTKIIEIIKVIFENKIKYLKFTSNKIKNDDQVITNVITNIQDITSEFLIQEERIKSEKLQSVGQLVAGVAHEINNPLSGILGYVQLLLEEPDLAGKADIIEDLKTIEKLSNRTKNIVKNLLSFSRTSSFNLERNNLKEVIEETLDLIHYELTKGRTNVEINNSIDNKTVLISKTHFQQVLINIFINSIHAMEENGGKIFIFADFLDNSGKKDLNYLRIHVKDTGKGIPQEILGKIFDPFFTTKTTGKGTGLGLSISYGIIKQHGGDITVQSIEGNGAEFIISLPYKNSIGEKNGTESI